MPELEISVDADLEIAQRSGLMDYKDAILIQILREVQTVVRSTAARAADTSAKKNIKLVSK